MRAIRDIGAVYREPSASARERCSHAGATLRFDDAGYLVSFEVLGLDLALATRATMATRARLYELCAFPDRQPGSVTVELVDIGREDAHTLTPRTAPGQRRTRSGSNRGSVIALTGRRTTCGSDSADDASPSRPLVVNSVHELEPCG